jgi:hypothetical protein
MQPADELNPYAPPTARVGEVESVSGYAGFKRFSTWGVLLLLVATFGIYLSYWLYTRGKRFNEVTQSERFSMGLAKALVIVACISLALGAIDSAMPDALLPLVLGALINLTYLVLQLSCCFNLRRCLSEHDGIDRTHPYWVGGLGTFFLHVLYLNYRLNQRIDADAASAKAT